MDIHMSKGNQEESYSKSSKVQKNLTDRALIPNLDEALSHLPLPPASGSGPIVVADLGCSSGPNSILLVSQVVEKLTKRLQIVTSNDDGKHLHPFEFQAFFNDLPSNDFNNLFHLLTSGEEVPRSSFFIAGVPGSYLDSLFPPSTVHVFVSTFALHYLSEVPSPITDKESAAFNRDTWFATGSQQNRDAVKVFRDQNAKDLGVFLKKRTEELVPGGLLCLGFFSRWNPRPEKQGRVESIELMFLYLESALKELLNKGIITQDQVDSFNLPIYFATFEELEEVVRIHASDLEVLKMKEVNVKALVDVPNQSPQETMQVVEAAASLYRGALGDLFRRQLGEEASQLFGEYLERDITANVIALSEESPITFLALKKKRVAPFNC